jgi:hypothetical protein
LLPADSVLTSTYAYQHLVVAIADYNSAIERRESLRSKSSRTDLEWLLAVVAPYLIAFALALRLTKVTAEIKAERR